MSETSDSDRCSCGCDQPCIHDIDDCLEALEEGMINGDPSHWPLLTQDLALVVGRHLIRAKPAAIHFPEGYTEAMKQLTAAVQGLTKQLGPKVVAPGAPHAPQCTCVYCRQNA